MLSKISLIIYSSTFPKVQISLYNTLPLSKGSCISIVSASPRNAVDSFPLRRQIPKVISANFPSSCSVYKSPRWAGGWRPTTRIQQCHARTWSSFVNSYGLLHTDLLKSLRNYHASCVMDIACPLGQL